MTPNDWPGSGESRSSDTSTVFSSAAVRWAPSLILPSDRRATCDASGEIEEIERTSDAVASQHVTKEKNSAGAAKAKVNSYGWGELADLNVQMMDTMPKYLRTVESVDKDPQLKAILIGCPLTATRKCGKIMDVEFVRIRKLKQEERIECRRQRRFQKRCTPRLEVLDKWEKKFSSPVEALPARTSRTGYHAATVLSKDFFARLKERERHLFLPVVAEAVP